MGAKRRIVFTEIIAIFFIILFIYAALNKIMDFEKFKIELAKSPILTAFSKLVAFSVPSVEIVIALLLVFKKSQYVALYASFCLMVIFSTYIIMILNFSTYIPCSCGGVLEKMTWAQHLKFNLGFVFLGVLGILFYPK